jgi:hypothetical protein
MNVAIVPDTDFGRVNGVTTTLTAAMGQAPERRSVERFRGAGDEGAETGPARVRPTTLT